jgi:hypothetical protein
MYLSQLKDKASPMLIVAGVLKSVKNTAENVTGVHTRSGEVILD